MISENTTDFQQYAIGFENLKVIAFRDLVINEWRIRILGTHFMDFGPEWNIKKHKHSFFEFHYVLQGNVYTNINGHEYDVKAGQFYLMPPGTIHSHRQGAGTSHTGFALRWEATRIDLQKTDYSNTFSEFERINTILSGAHSRPLTDHDGIVLDDMKSLLQMTERRPVPLDLQLLFIRELIHIAGFYSHKTPDYDLDKNVSYLENHIVDTAIRFIEENYMQAIEVMDVAHSAHLSYSHLSRLFKKYSGETIIHHINKVRLLKSQHLLSCTSKTISQIADEVGFNNKNYFCTIFKKFFHVSPGHYRNNKTPLSE